MAVLAELQIPADVEHIRDPLAISQYGVMGTPALVVNEKVVSVGKVPLRSALKSLIADAWRKD
ncbi:MAG: hypothetical protein A2V65_05770 [Deltaproteobacteria bacterium RBG_13_49_15]|nr:MAG: hypothetical protein A2V65_05770 [Deltaproteobacteria bacterium RBG_13_49_15]